MPAGIEYHFISDCSKLRLEIEGRAANSRENICRVFALFDFVVSDLLCAGGGQVSL